MSSEDTSCLDAVPDLHRLDHTLSLRSMFDHLTTTSFPHDREPHRPITDHANLVQVHAAGKPRHVDDLLVTPRSQTSPVDRQDPPPQHVEQRDLDVPISGVQTV